MTRMMTAAQMDQQQRCVRQRSLPRTAVPDSSHAICATDWISSKCCGSWAVIAHLQYKGTGVLLDGLQSS